MGVDVQVQSYFDVLVLSMSGRINHSGADEFRTNLLPYVEDDAAPYSKIVLDMEMVEYMSSVGLRALMLAAKKSKELGRVIAVAGLNSTMREIFEISRFNLVFSTFDSVRDAIAALSPSALASFENT